jgi:hypothetical protein
MKTGIELIAIERKEQIKKHGRSVKDDKLFNKKLQLRRAASVLLQPNAIFYSPPVGWDKELWNKMIKKRIKQRLIIAGALIAAEIDRIAK